MAKYLTLITRSTARMFTSLQPVMLPRNRTLNHRQYGLMQAQEAEDAVSFLREGILEARALLDEDPSSDEIKEVISIGNSSLSCVTSFIGRHHTYISYIKPVVKSSGWLQC